MLRKPNQPPPFKFGGPDLSSDTPHDYGHLWCREDFDTWSRLAVGPSFHHIDILLQLAGALPPPYGLLWVLVQPTSGLEPARYQSPIIETHDELSRVLTRYRNFFEQDGRHHLWVMNVHRQGQIVYDNHNILYAYGPLDTFAEILADLGLSEGPVEIPAPHTHGFNPANADTERAFHAEFAWVRSPLIPDHDEP